MHDGQKSHVYEYLKNNTRYDGRKLDAHRDLKIEYGVTKTAEGSARVTLGDTEVIAGVKFELGTPYPDKPDEGTISVNAELLPMSSPDFEAGPPGIDAIELARVVDRGIRESEALDFKKLCVTPNEKVWIVMIDVCSINDCGNLLDAAGIAAIAAIKDAKFPSIKEDGSVDYKHMSDDKVEVETIPVPVTVFKINDKYVVDPITEEEKVADSRLTVTTMSDGRICALQKGGLNPVSLDDIKNMVKLASDSAVKIRKVLEK